MHALKRTIRWTIMGILLSVQSWAQIPGFTLDAQIEGLPDGEKVEMECYGRSSLDCTINDSAVVKNGRFLIKGTVINGPREYYVVLKNTRKTFYLWLNNGDHVTLRCPDVRKIKKSGLDDDIQLEGDVSTHAWNEFSGAAIFYNHALQDLNGTIQQITDSVGFDPRLLEGLFTARKALNESIYYHLMWFLYKVKKDSSVAQVVPVISQLSEANFRNQHVAELKKIYYRLQPAVRESHYMQLLKEQLPLLVGEPFPVFTLATAEGKKVSLKDTIARSKITLVHLWAASSVFRQEYQEDIRKLYDKYHSLGFSVVGVSSDDSSTEYNYRKALREEKFPWTNVCDLKGVQGIVNTVYHAFSDPGYELRAKVHNTTNVLVDPQGRVISWDPTGVELQYYIWKYTESQAQNKQL